MALPSTNITFNAVNVELNGISSGTISLDNARVRSLGQNVAASGTSFSVSSLASKSAKWAQGVDLNIGSQYSYSTPMPRGSDGNSFFQIFYDAAQVGLQIQRLYLNGQVASRAQVTPSSGGNAPYWGAAAGPYSTSNLYILTAGGTRSALCKVSPSGTLLGSAIFSTPQGVVIQDRNYSGPCRTMAVDTSENVYIVLGARTATLGDGTPIYNCAITSLNSSLAIRWSRYMNYITNPGSSTVSAAWISGLDSSDNLYVTYTQYNNPYNALGLIKFNSSGTVLFNISFYCGTAANQGIILGRTGVGPNGQTALVCTGNNSGVPANGQFYIVYFNSSGVNQWVVRIPIYGNQFLNEQDGDCVIDASGNVYVAIQGYDSYRGGYEVFVVKLNSSGTVQWQKRFYNDSTSYPSCFLAVACLSLSGNDSLLSISLTTGLVGEYDLIYYPCMITISSNGSNGNGTYSLSPATALVVNSSSPLSFLSGSITSTSTLGVSTGSVSVAGTGVVSQTPTTFTTVVTNIS